MTHHLRNLGLLIFLFFLLQSCISNRAFQTARTVPKHEIGLGFGTGTQTSKYIRTSSDGTPGDTSDVGGFTAEVFTRYGLGERMDAGFYASLPGSLGLDAKYQWIGDAESKLAVSSGLGFGYNNSEYDSRNHESRSVLELIVPMYISYHPLPNWGIYASPRFKYHVYGLDNLSYFGGIAGLRFGQKNGLFIEYCYLEPSSDRVYSNQAQLNIGLGIGIP